MSKPVVEVDFELWELMGNRFDQMADPDDSLEGTEFDMGDAIIRLV